MKHRHVVVCSMQGDYPEGIHAQLVNTYVHFFADEAYGMMWNYLTKTIYSSLELKLNRKEIIKESLWVKLIN